MDRDHSRMRLVLLLVIAINIPILLIPFFMIADAIVATDKGPVIQHDHAGCLSSLIPKQLYSNVIYTPKPSAARTSF
ncbi:transmembrane protein, putative [Medicago truncatula]|uniref:Transmembrane protein, putative n=1 Tax=Medicago truncatula TaxID=3880 RepID=G7I7Q8_MEDTR|nr:transmembrane protein, putative [Medicago truncatula]